VWFSPLQGVLLAFYLARMFPVPYRGVYLKTIPQEKKARTRPSPIGKVTLIIPTLCPFIVTIKGKWSSPCACQ
jgi:hypothetical protein